MTIANFDLIERFARERFARAYAASLAIKFALNESKHFSSKEAGSIEARASGIGNEPHFARLETEVGVAAWAVILSVDLRGSTKRAIRIGARDTYLTMHTYLPTMAKLVTEAEGQIIGLRGDGLFACFGLKERTGNPGDITTEQANCASRQASSCGKAMLEATEEILNPIMDENNIESDLQVGVGISYGEIVVTRIGLFDANEVTAYGPPVNSACKLSSDSNNIMFDKSARDVFPTGKGGRVTFQNYGGHFIVNYPRDLVMLERSSTYLRKAR